MLRELYFALLCSMAMGSALEAQPTTGQVDRFFDDVYFKFNPTAGTATGFHQYDAQLEDYSKAGRRRADPGRCTAPKSNSPRCPTDPDRDLILYYIRATLLDLEQVRSWEKNPDMLLERSHQQHFRDHEPHLRAPRPIA